MRRRRPVSSSFALGCAEHAPKGARVNTIVPAVAHADGGGMVARAAAGGDIAARRAQRLDCIPIGFAGDGRDTANAALFLASMKRASSRAPSWWSTWDVVRRD